MTQVELIRAEIDRLYNSPAPKHDQQCDFEDGYFTGISKIDDFLDTLQEPKKGLDVTEFCQPVDPDIAKSVADHWFEMLEEDKTEIPKNQPEVDLKKKALNFGEEIGVPVCENFMRIARHFYELGKNAK